MKLSYKDFRPRIVLALLAVVGTHGRRDGGARRDLEGVSEKRSPGHVISNLETMSRGVVLLQQDSVARVRRLPTNRRTRYSPHALSPIPTTSIHDAFEAWITPLYQSRGFDDYSLISADGKRVMTSDPTLYRPVAAAVAGNAATGRCCWQERGCSADIGQARFPR